MTVLEQPTRHIKVRIGRTLAPARGRPRPYRAAVKAAAQVGLLVAAVVVMVQQGPDAVAHTLFFGAAALVYLMADFVLELPAAPDPD
jgi:hypothetical protein